MEWVTKENFKVQFCVDNLVQLYCEISLGSVPGTNLY